MGGSLEQLETFANGVGVHDIEAIVQWLKLLQVVDGVGNEFLFNEGVLDGLVQSGWWLLATQNSLIPADHP